MLKAYGEDSLTVINIMLRPEPEGGYTALVPALPGCVTYGRTVDEAREMAKDAISGYIASLRKHKDPIPTDDNTLSSRRLRVFALKIFGL